VLIGVERKSDRGNPPDAVAFQHRCQFFLRGLDAGADGLDRSIVCRNGVECAGQIVGHGQDIAGKAGGGILHGIGLVALEPPPGILGFRGDAQSPLAFGIALFGQCHDLGTRRGKGAGAVFPNFPCIRCRFVACCLFRHAINLPSLFAVKSTMGMTRA
jgi:hypothetical protein